MKASESITLFMQQPHIAVVGVSRNKNKFGNAVYRTLKKRGVHVIPVNPHLTHFEGDKCYSDVQTLPSEVKAIFVNTPPETTLKIVENAVHKGIQHIWLQQGSTNDEVLKYMYGKGVNYISDRCILMFAEPVGSFHRVHKFLSKVSGNYPK